MISGEYKREKGVVKCRTRGKKLQSTPFRLLHVSALALVTISTLLSLTWKHLSLASSCSTFRITSFFQRLPHYPISPKYGPNLKRHLSIYSPRLGMAKFSLIFTFVWCDKKGMFKLESSITRKPANKYYKLC